MRWLDWASMCPPVRLVFYIKTLPCHRNSLRHRAGLTISTEVCQQFYSAGGQLPEGLWEEVLAGLTEVEAAYGCKFADPVDPLLLSVRSGAGTL